MQKLTCSRPVIQPPILPTDEHIQEIIKSLISGMSSLYSSRDSDQPKYTDNYDNTEIWLVEWTLPSAASLDTEKHGLTARTGRHASGNILSWIAGPRITHWAVEIRDFRYELQRYGHWPFFWHGYIQIEMKEARKRKPFRKVCIGTTNLSDIEIWVAGRP